MFHISEASLKTTSCRPRFSDNFPRFAKFLNEKSAFTHAKFYNIRKRKLLPRPRPLEQLFDVIIISQTKSRFAFIISTSNFSIDTCPRSD